MITITFEAHATSLDNEAGLASGWNDVALSRLGEQQARDMGQRYEGQKLHAIFCSDLQRSCRTAELAFGDVFPIVKDGRLRECDYGDLTQADKDLVNAQKPKRISIPFPNGESYEDCYARMKSFLDDLRRDYDGKTVMIIGHRATQYGLEAYIKGIPITDAVTAPWKWQPGWKYEVV